MEKMKISYKQFKEKIIVTSAAEHVRVTNDMYKLAFKKFQKIIDPNIFLEKIGRSDVEVFRSQCINEGLQKASINNHHSILKRAFNKAIEWGYIDTSPFNEIPLYKNVQQKQDTLTKKELLTFFRSIKDMEILLIAISLYASQLKRGELLNLKWSDFNDAEKYFNYYSSLRKKVEICQINLTFAQALSVLFQLYGNKGKVFQRYKPDTITHKIKDAFKEAGNEFAKFKLSSLQRSFKQHQIMNSALIDFSKDNLELFKKFDLNIVKPHKVPDFIDSIDNPASFITNEMFRRVSERIEKAIIIFNPEFQDKLHAINTNLLSANSENLSNAVHSCRRMLKDTADILYPPTNEEKEIGNKKIQLKSNNYINRLIAFINENSNSKNYKNLIGSHLKFIGERLDSIANASQKGTHDAIPSQEEADRYVTYTYLIISDIVQLKIQGLNNV